MPVHRRKLQRSATEWALRGILAALVLAMGWINVAHSFGYSLRITNPPRAYAFAPGDGRVAAQLAARMSGVKASAGDRARADQLAHKALRSEPLAVAAVSTLGTNVYLRGDVTAARRLFAYAEHLSRRDLQTQLWLTEDAVQRGAVPDALRHYDIALRTSRTVPDLLFPILASAITESSIRAELVKSLSTSPPWGANLVAYIAEHGPDPQASVSLFLAMRRRGLTVPEEAEARLIATLVARNLMEPAWSFYASTRRSADRRQSRDADFTGDTAFASPFDWNPINEAGTSVSVQRLQKGGLADFSAPASVGGPLLRQLQLLPPGQYRITGRSTGISQPVELSPYWTLICPDGRELGRVVVSSSAETGGAFSGQLSVPANCPWQTLTLVARPSDSVGGLSGQINRVQLAPAQ